MVLIPTLPLTNPVVGKCGCSDGFVYIACTVNNYCRSCHPTCRTCTDTGITLCLSCYSNSTL